MFTHVFLPDHGQEQRACTGHNCNVGQDPFPVGVLKRFTNFEKERVLRDRAHHIVADTRWHRATQEGVVRQQGVEAAFTAVVEVDVDAAIVREHEIADTVGTLNRVWVGFECRCEPGVFFFYECQRGGVCPEDVFVVAVEVHTGLLGCLPLRWDRLVDVGLVDDLGD